jgi:GTP pyrophosphokinase
VASRTQTLRYFTDHPGDRESIARESLDIYAPLANRLGIWQLKWELEDLSFRFLEPDTYKRIARMLDERRVEREQFIVDAVARLKAEVAAIGVKAEVYGRPKHIYSIYNKMRAKRLDFSQIFDVRRCACWWTR